MEEQIYFYYTNDLHSNFDNWSQVSYFLKQAKHRCQAAGDSCWTVDIGDHMDRVHPIAEAFKGKANVALLNEAGYDIATIGNNEGITISHDELVALYEEARFTIVCANLHSKEGEAPDWLQSYTLVTSEHGVKIAVVGLTAPFNAYYELLGWYASPPYEQLEKILGTIKRQADVIILLSHLGYSEDCEIARRFPGIDVIIGGHTHHLLRNGELVNHTLLSAAGKHCHYIGEVILTWDHNQGRLKQKQAYATNITHLPKDLDTDNLLTAYQERAERILAKPVAQLSSPLEVNWRKVTPILQALTDALKRQTNADCAMLNAGVLLESLPEGTVTYGDIHRICPHPINTCVVELTGSELLEAIRSSLTEEFIEFELKGFGFRGKMIGRMAFSGLTLQMEELKDRALFVKQAFQNDGIPLQPDRIYTLATADTFTFGRLIPEIARSEVKNYYLPEFLRDILAQTLQSM
ncbi:bifunctional metallophosphatase/5'-nucleotidase [Virgibacillus pantothenticus]|uniref:bifunctional metallophosphatase/5'-nucleotidase n=1 Tax=Virgibacillus pantothenticus TaxID=1473 RepID=UPI0025B1E9C0|nr:bifunctional UDP-sugar hydrolase/5'-nucleotidase [Virgibacillus pantothenticus]